MIAAALAVLAAAGPTPLAPAPNAGFALAGDHALLAHVEQHRLRVSAVPLSGGAPRPVFAFDGPAGARISLRLAASAQRAAATIEVEDRRQVTTLQMVTGPALGPWTAVAPATADPPFPLEQRVDGDRVFTTEVRGRSRETAVVVRDPDPHDLPLQGIEATFAPFAGELMAYPTNVPGEPDWLGRRLVIADWRTAAVRRTVDFPDVLHRFALRADGRAAVIVDDPGALYDLRPGQSPKRYRVDADDLQFAGDHLVFTGDDGDRPRVLDPDGTIRPLGPPTRSLRDLDTGDAHVLWIANDCLLVAPVTARATDPPGPGPCSRGEIAVANMRGAPKLARTVPAPLRCVTAPTRCKGTVNLVWTRGDTVRTRVRVTAGTRFSIPSGRTHTVRIRLSNAGLRRLRVHLRRHRRATLAVEPVSDGGARVPEYAPTWMRIRE